MLIALFVIQESDLDYMGDDWLIDPDAYIPNLTSDHCRYIRHLVRESLEYIHRKCGQTITDDTIEKIELTMLDVYVESGIDMIHFAIIGAKNRNRTVVDHPNWLYPDQNNETGDGTTTVGKKRKTALSMTHVPRLKTDESRLNDLCSNFTAI